MYRFNPLTGKLDLVGAPTTVDYLVYTANAALPNAVVMQWGNYIQVAGTATLNTISVLPDFSDSDFKIHDNSDATKIGVFEASGITTGTTRTYTLPNATGTLALTSDLSAYLLAANNLSDLTNAATARTNLGLVAGGTGDIWVEKAGDTMTGKLYIGFANTLTFNATPITTNFSVQSEAFSAIDQQTFTASAGLGSTLYQVRARGTAASPTVVASGDDLAKWIVAGYDGTDYATGGYMAWTTDGTPGSNDMPTSWGLYLTPDGTQSPAEAVTVASTGISTWRSTMNIVPGSDINALTLRPFGTSTAIKTFDILDSSGNSWCYIRKRLLSDAETGCEMQFTSSGTTGIFRNAFSIGVAAGYTGSAFTGVLNFDNLMAGTNTTYTADATLYGYRVGGNRGIGGYCRAVTAGHNVGVLALAGNGAVNYGMWGSSTTTKSSAVNVGVFANAHNATATSPAFIGLYATCFNTAATAPPNMAGVKTALLADNQTFACDIGIFRDNGTEVFKIADGGATSVTTAATAGGLLGFTIFPGAHTAVTAEKNTMYVRGNTVTITGGFTNYRNVQFDPHTIDAASALTVTNAATVAINGAPGVSGSAVITNTYAFWIQGGNSRHDGKNSFGGVVTPTALVHLAAGTASANTAPLKFDSGTKTTTAEAGTHEYNGNHLLANATLRFPVGGTLFDYSTDSTVGGAEADIYTSTLAASTFNGNGDKVVASYGGNFVTVGTELTQLKVYFAGTAIWDSTGVAPTTGTTSWRVYVELIRVSSTVIRYTISLNTTGASGFVYCTVGELTGLTLSNTNILKLTGTSTGVGSGSGDIIGKMGYVRFDPAS